MLLSYNSTRNMCIGSEFQNFENWAYHQVIEQEPWILIIFLNLICNKSLFPPLLSFLDFFVSKFNFLALEHHEVWWSYIRLEYIQIPVVNSIATKGYNSSTALDLKELFKIKYFHLLTCLLFSCFLWFPI